MKAHTSNQTEKGFKKYLRRYARSLKEVPIFLLFDLLEDFETNQDPIFEDINKFRERLIEAVLESRFA